MPTERNNQRQTAMQSQRTGNEPRRANAPQQQQATSPAQGQPARPAANRPPRPGQASVTQPQQARTTRPIQNRSARPSVKRSGRTAPGAHSGIARSTQQQAFGIGIVPIIAAVAIVVALIFFIPRIFALFADNAGNQSGIGSTKAARVSLTAVGDNLTERDMCLYAEAADGKPGDGHYDYTVLYKPVRSYIENADLAYINQEVHLGNDDYGPRGYPSFNVTSEMADCLVDLGFDFVASASNHCCDWGPQALAHSVDVFKDKPLAYTGTANNEEDAKKIVTLERDGVTFALLNYTYGVNAFGPNDLPSYAVNFMDKERIPADIARAKEVADVVLVAMHWGTELLTEANDEQREYAQLIADAGADMIIGSHPHCIQPMEWYTGKDGNKMLCIYSLGNFICAHDSPGPLAVLEGMVTCDFVRDKGSKDIRIENVVWVPLVSHRAPNEDGVIEYAVYPLKDYTEEMADKAIDSLGRPNMLETHKQKTREVIGDQFTIDL